jgi:hypothetical protein
VVSTMVRVKCIKLNAAIAVRKPKFLLYRILTGRYIAGNVTGNTNHQGITDLVLFNFTFKGPVSSGSLFLFCKSVFYFFSPASMIFTRAAATSIDA